MPGPAFPAHPGPSLPIQVLALTGSGDFCLLLHPERQASLFSDEDATEGQAVVFYNAPLLPAEERIATEQITKET